MDTCSRPSHLQCGVLEEVNLCRFHRAEDEKGEEEVERITVLSTLDIYEAQGLNAMLTTTV